MHLGALILHTWKPRLREIRYTRRLRSSEIAGVLGGCRFGGSQLGGVMGAETLFFG